VHYERELEREGKWKVDVESAGNSGDRELRVNVSTQFVGIMLELIQCFKLER
jgi:hypothetical protein